MNVMLVRICGEVALNWTLTTLYCLYLLSD